MELMQLAVTSMKELIKARKEMLCTFAKTEYASVEDVDPLVWGELQLMRQLHLVVNFVNKFASNANPAKPRKR